MTLLLDTQAFLWWVGDDPHLPSRARRAIADPRNRVLFSVVSTWEIAMKAASGRLTLSMPFSRFIDEQLRRNAFEVLDVGLAHVMRSVELPRLHDDPFDRLLIGQALAEGAHIVSGDRMITKYPVKTRW